MVGKKKKAVPLAEVKTKILTCGITMYTFVGLPPFSQPDVQNTRTKSYQAQHIHHRNQKERYFKNIR